MTLPPFRIDDGERNRVRYTWIAMRRRAPKNADLLLIEPNQSVTDEIDLDKFYGVAGKPHFDISVDERFYLQAVFMGTELRPPDIRANHLLISR